MIGPMPTALTRPAAPPLRAFVLAALAAMMALVALGAPAARAGQLQVSVLDTDGKPVPDVAVSVQPTGIWPSQPLPEPVTIVQQASRFVPYVTVVPVGTVVRFVNRDRYDHHVRSQPGGPLGNIAPAQQFEFRLAALRGGREAREDLKTEVPGTVALGCHIHGSMRGHLVISTTPWVGVSDERGQVTLANVPDGPVQLRLWHPDQLLEQPAQRLQAAGTASVEARLNFSPKPRRVPAAPARDYNSLTTY